ncbi:MAG: 4Fe-4S dicluster domain-containing protein [Chloroflexi bacterium]|nr:4Fe-4S dicluster domain-containing protein [Chloroflexota bacterium]
MADVYNWQLGREMQYRFSEVHPERQFVAVFNINRCIACQTCTMACKSTWTFSRGQEYMWWNNVETKPYGGYPHHWDLKLLKLLQEANPGGQRWDASQQDDRQPYGVFNGMTIFEAAAKEGNEHALGYLPTDQDWTAPNLYEDTAKGPKGRQNENVSDGAELPEHKTWFFYLQRICNHCTYPGCVSACPRNAIYKRPEDGIVLIDQERCRGYRKCVEQCPYKKSMYRPNTQVSEKCIGCYPRVEGSDPLTEGIPMETRCMASCVGKIRLQGLVRIENGEWAEDRNNPLHFLVRQERVALPLYPQFGTEPNIYYIPPRWVPRQYLRQMFGPGVDDAIERYTNPSRELLAILQLFRASQQIVFRYEFEEGEQVVDTEVNGRPFEMYNDTIVGFNSEDKEIVRLSVVEPFFERPSQYQNSI